MKELETCTFHLTLLRWRNRRIGWMVLVACIGLRSVNSNNEWRNVKTRVHVGYLNIDGRILLSKSCKSRLLNCGVHWNELEEISVNGFYEYGRNNMKFLDQLIYHRRLEGSPTTRNCIASSSTENDIQNVCGRARVCVCVWVCVWVCATACSSVFFLILVCEAIGTAATPGLLCQPRVVVKMIMEK
jgi:hypothetical protein